ncbi:MAG: hypothetical protein HY554_02770 [Elusimicrobia bacterium]|nr:hypothetical protein [Elusimicrobiota bacterium]
MTESAPAVRCWGCQASLEAADSYCRRCGRGQGEHVAWYYRWWGIVLATVFGLGPFGLILVWRSPALGPAGKWGASAAILAVTAWLCVRLYQAFELARSLLAAG